jgi:hypothetical protein
MAARMANGNIASVKFSDATGAGRDGLVVVASQLAQSFGLKH